jgi:coproporphyrinogen III oxidase-like Fe-S oxidoreductase
MKFKTFEQIDKFRKDKHICTEVNVKESLYESKHLKSRQSLYKIWNSYIKNNNPNFLAFYFHTPFCYKICKYCGYHSDKINKIDEIDTFLDKIEKEIKIYKQIFKNSTFTSLYMGGGTASIYNIEQLKRVYSLIFDNFKFNELAETAQEFSLLTITKEKIDLALKYGFNKFTFGIQSFDKEVLQTANREYLKTNNIKEHINYILEKEPTAFITCDLIWGLPKDTPEKLHNSIKTLLDLNVPNIIIYHYHHSKHIQDRNKGDEYYDNYIEPYEQDEVVKVVKSFKSQYKDYTFYTGIGTCIQIRNYVINGKGKGFIPYYTHPFLNKKNSTLGLGKYSRSFIENYFKYEDYDDKILFYNLIDKEYIKNMYIVDEIFENNKINRIEYKKQFNSDILVDFKDNFDFLSKNHKCKIDDEFIEIIYNSTDDLTNIEISFMPDKVVEFYEKNRP